MTAKSDPVRVDGAEAAEPPPWRSNLGRLRLTAAAAAVCGVVAVWTLHLPFYEMHADDVVIVDDYQRSETMSVSASVSAFDLVAQDPQAAISPQGAGVANTNVPTSMFALPVLGKLPTAGAWLLFAAAAVAAACAVQSLLVLGAGGACWFLAFRSHSAMVALVEDPNAGGLLVERGSGIGLFELTMYALLGAVGIPTAVQLWKIRAARREDRRRRAKEKGSEAEVEISWLDWLRGAAMTGASAVGENARRSAEARQAS